MSSLGDFQSAMRASLHDSAAACPGQVVEQGTDRQSRRFNIYRNNRMVSLIDNLTAAYPTVHQLVGDDFFRAVARLYIQKTPPRSPVMAEYGGDFDRFLDAFPNTQGVPYLADIATLEWCRLCSYHAQDAAAVRAEVLSEISPESLESTCFSMHPSLFLVSSQWPVGSIWSAIANNADQPVVDMNRAEEVMVVRAEHTVSVQILPADGAELLKQLRDGKPLLAAVEIVTRRFPDFDPGTHLQGLFGLGIFNAIYQRGVSR